MRKHILFTLLLSLLFASCSDYYKILKSNDYEVKWEAAKRYYGEKKYKQSATILEELYTSFKGTDKAEESLYLLAQSYYNAKDWITASQYFKQYYNAYPRGEYTELSRFYSAMCYYNDSPEWQLDQSETNKGIREFQMFLEYFPTSDMKDEAQEKMKDLQDKLALKAFKNAELYYFLGTYMGNNYLSSVITAQNALRDFPFTSLKEDLYALILRAKYQEAVLSVPEKQADRYRSVIDEFYNYRNEFPEGKYLKEAIRYYTVAQRNTGADREEGEAILSELQATEGNKQKTKKNPNAIK